MQCDLDPVDAHRLAVQIWLVLTEIASASYPKRPTPEQLSVYGLLPAAIDAAKAAWLKVPVEKRSLHYLMDN